jgi:asparagine synthase (glutamine-hydrolysing)
MSEISGTLTGIVGVRSSREAEAASKMKEILQLMEIRGSIIRSAIVPGKNDFLAIGSCSHSNEDSSVNRPDRSSLVVDGSIPGDLESEEIGGEPDRASLAEALQSPHGFGLIAISEGRMLVARDALGQKPIYHGSDKSGTIVIASLKHAIAQTGIKRVSAVAPGKLLEFSKRGVSTVASNALTKPREIKISEDAATDRLKRLLVESLNNEVSQDIALAFSGGLDSTLVAKAAMENDLKPELITVGMKGQTELDHAKKVAKQLGLDITTKELSAPEVLESLPRVIEIVESADPVLVGVSVPLFFACEVAEEMEADCLLAGQLSDEIFAGYGRFDELASKKDSRKARDEVWKSVLAASMNDFEPGDKLAVSHRLRLRCPFAFLPLVQFALRLPISLKLRVVADQVVRKYVLRRVATNWNLPDVVANRPKKAVQYSSGVQKVLLKEAKRKGMTLGKFVESFL